MERHMKLTTLRCPHCGSAIHFQPGRIKTICEYCDSEIFVEEMGDAFVEHEEIKHEAKAAGYTEYTNGSDQGYSQSGDQEYSQSSDQNYNYGENYREPNTASNASFPVSYRSRTITLILCFFLGVLGAHHFYAGRFGMGIAYFFTGGLFGFGWFVDCIRILLGTFRDREGMLIYNW